MRPYYHDKNFDRIRVIGIYKKLEYILRPRSENARGSRLRVSNLNDGQWRQRKENCTCTKDRARRRLKPLWKAFLG